MGCLFCNCQEPNYKPGPDVDFICSSCVQLLLGADQDDLHKAHAKAIEKGYPAKAKAIESFLIEDEYNVRETEKFKRNLERKRSLPAIRPSRYQVRA
ncbi:MAG TPA: hypothetical protein VMW95_09415 [Desulfobacterales bacterium]|nr:hypothetical protein [Desulfobacterales bacterium]